MRRLPLVLLATAACAREPAPRPSVADALPAASLSTPGPASPSAAPPIASAPPPAAAPSAPALTLTNLETGAFEIGNPGRDAREVAVTAALQRREGDSWADVPGLDANLGYRLVETCPAPEAAPPACVRLGAGAVLRPVPWQGLSCSAQCNGTCRANAWLGPGTFRLAVRSCDGGAVTVGPPFELPGPDHSGPALKRWGLSGDALTATVARLDLGPHAAGAKQIAGFDARARSGRPLSAADLSALVALLRSPRGYNDTIARRCLMKHLVGFRIERQLATTGEPRQAVTEIAIDFQCHKLLAVSRSDASVGHGTHFDGLHADYLALVQRALPDDAEIAKLR